METPLKWPGSKRLLAKSASKLIKNSLNEKSNIVEPFCGSAAFSLHYEFQNVHLNDTNSALINFFEWFRQGLEMSESDFEVSESYYYRTRSLLNKNMLNGELGEDDAKRFWFLNKHTFNGLIRQCKTYGRFNMPWGYKKRLESIPNPLRFTEVTSAWQLSCGDFLDLDFDGADLIFADPPYEKVEGENSFQNYSSGCVNNIQATMLEKLASFDGKCILTNALSPELAKLYISNGFKVYTVSCVRSISRDSNSRGKKRELIAFRGFTQRKLKSYVEDMEPYRC